jgi:hypothetical protein
MGCLIPIITRWFDCHWLYAHGDLFMNPRFHLKYAMIVTHLMADDKEKWSKIYFFHVKQYLKGSK